METRIGGTEESFPATQWSIVRAAGDASSPEFQSALEELVASYWKPVYAFIRRKGHSVEDAKDLTQDFFETALRRNLAGRARPERGAFRAFLLASVRNSLRDALDRKSAARRGGDRPRADVDLDALSPREREIADDASSTPEEAFQREWAQGLLEGALRDLKRHYGNGEREVRARLFERYVDLLAGGSAPDYAALAAEFGLSATDVTNYLHRARLLYRRLLRDRIRQSVARPEEVEEEIRDLFAFLG
jgi:RNA polymerase sigma-70 factor (ECF subfamily)